jgi:predicted acyl esterase
MSNHSGSKALFASGESPPADYDRAPTYEKMIREQDVYVPMRDGVKLCVDNAEYVPYHVCSSKTVLHKIYHDANRPSHLLLPVIPNA